MALKYYARYSTIIERKAIRTGAKGSQGTNQIYGTLNKIGQRIGPFFKLSRDGSRKIEEFYLTDNAAKITTESSKILQVNVDRVLMMSANSWDTKFQIIGYDELEKYDKLNQLYEVLIVTSTLQRYGGSQDEIYKVNIRTENIIGDYIDTIIAEEGTYPENGVSGNYWYIEGDYVNKPPIISGNDYDYKSVTDDFEIEYLVTDTDVDDIVNVEILTGLVGSLGEKVREHTPISLGMKYKYLVPAKSLPIGNYFVKIVATDKNGARSERNYLFERVNSIPLITSTLTSKLGDKNTGFTIPYKVSDTNVDDKLSVTVRINNKTVDQKANVKHNEELYYTVTNEMLLSYELNKEVTIEIEVVDDKGASNRLIFAFTRTNALPIISDNDKDLGSFEVSPEFKFSISDTEKDEIYYSLYLDDKKLEDQLTIEDGEEKTYKFSHDDWIRIDPSKNHIFRIVATDKHAIEIAGEDRPQTVERKFTFKRICNRLEVNFRIAESVEKTEELDTSQLKGLVGRVTAMTLTPDIVVAGGAVVKYLVTNNGNDENPTWENATDSVLAGVKYFFTNETKTAEKWLYMVKVIVERNIAIENSRLKALAGSWGYNDYTM